MATQYRTVSSVNFSLAFLLVALCLGYLLFTAVHVGAAKGGNGNGKGKPQKPQKPHPQHNSTHPIKPVRNETNSIDSVQGGNGNGGNGNGKGGNGKKKPQKPQKPHPQHNSTHPIQPVRNETNSVDSVQGGNGNGKGGNGNGKKKPQKPQKPHPQHNSTHPIQPERNETNANTPVNDRTLIDKINSNQHGWTATEYPRFANLTIGKIRDSLFGLSILLEDQDTPRVDGEPRIELPTSFDARTAWANCVPTIRDQRSCGACWAFSSSYVLAHRLCVATGGRTKVVLSPEYQVQCDTMEKACQGGYLKYAWQFLQNTGTTLDSCTPYASGSGTFSKGTCPTTCTTTSMAMTKYKAKNYKYISGINNIKAAIMTFGSVQGGFTVYRDFMTYKSGVYKHVSTTTLGGHAVALIGWGTEGGVNYWLAANSWSVNWGDKGYFKIAQGEGGIDSQVYAGEAAV